MAEFVAVLGGKPNQIDRQRDGESSSGSAVWIFGPMPRSLLKRAYATNINVGIPLSRRLVIGPWLRADPLNLMEDAATAEISRSQIWQWIKSPRRSG